MLFAYEWSLIDMGTTNIADPVWSYDIMVKIRDTLIKKIDLLLNLNDVNTLPKDIYNGIITSNVKEPVLSTLL